VGFGEKIMKKYILAPLCSALIIPGLGQVINQQLRKGALLLGAVFVLLVLAIVYLSIIVESILSQQGSSPLSLSLLFERVELLLILGVFGVIWIYSIVDAFLKGWSWENREKR
jgi:flagellar biosynthesis protein FlhB